MPKLPEKKVGIVSCSGEEVPEGTVTRLATLKVLHELRPDDTVTICLPLFLAGGQGERAFARFYPTITVDGCEQRCAARATEMYSAKPAASIVVRDLVGNDGLASPEGRGRLSERGRAAVEATASRIVTLVDELRGERVESVKVVPADEPVGPTAGKPASQATCSCGTPPPPSAVIRIAGEPVRVYGLPLVLDDFFQRGIVPDEAAGRELVKAVHVYHYVSREEEAAYADALLHAYAVHCAAKKVSR